MLHLGILGSLMLNLPAATVSASADDNVRAIEQLGEELWSLLAELEEEGTVDKDAKVALFPPLARFRSREEGRTLAVCEELVDILRRSPGGPGLRRVLRGRKLADALEAGALGTVDYGRRSSAELFQALDCGLLVTGSLTSREGSLKPSYVLVLVAEVRTGSGERAQVSVEFDESLSLTHRSGSELYDRLELDGRGEPEVAFGANGCSAPAPGIVLAAWIDALIADLRENARAAGLDLSPDGPQLGVFVAGGGLTNAESGQRDLSRRSKLGDALVEAARRDMQALGPNSVDDTLRLLGLSSDDYLEDPVSATILAAAHAESSSRNAQTEANLGLPGGSITPELEAILFPRAVYETGTRRLSLGLQLQSGAGRLAAAQRSRILVRDDLHDFVLDLSARPSDFVLDEPVVDAEPVLVRALRLLMSRLIDQERATMEAIEGCTVEFLPLETPGSKALNERLVSLNVQLDKERLRLLRLVEDEGITTSEAFQSRPVSLPLLLDDAGVSQRFDSWQAAREAVYEKLVPERQTGEGALWGKQILEGPRLDLVERLPDGVRLLAGIDSTQAMVDSLDERSRRSPTATPPDNRDTELQARFRFPHPDFFIAVQLTPTGKELRIDASLRDPKDAATQRRTQSLTLRSKVARDLIAKIRRFED